MEKNQGFIMVEAVFMVTMTFLVLSILMGFSFVVYQQTNIVVTANDAASKIASVYGMPEAEPFTGYRSVDTIGNVKLYKYMFEDSAFFGLRRPLKDTNGEKARWLSLALLENSAIIKAKEQKIDVEVSRREFLVGGSHTVTVRLEQTYDVPGAFAFQFFGIPDEVTFTAEGTALANDMAHRMNTVDTQTEALSYVEDNLFGLKTASGVADAVEQCIKTLTAWLRLGG